MSNDENLVSLPIAVAESETEPTPISHTIVNNDNNNVLLSVKPISENQSSSTSTSSSSIVTELIGEEEEAEMITTNTNNNSSSSAANIPSNTNVNTNNNINLSSNPSSSTSAAAEQQQPSSSLSSTTTTASTGILSTSLNSSNGHYGTDQGLSSSPITSTSAPPRKRLTITSSLPTPPSEISVLHQVNNNNENHHHHDNRTSVATNNENDQQQDPNNNSNNNNGLPSSAANDSTIDPYDLGITSSGRKIRDSLIICSAPLTSSTTLPFSTLSLAIQSTKRNSTSSTTSSQAGGGGGGGAGANNTTTTNNGGITNRKKEKNVTPSIVTSTQQVLVTPNPNNDDPKYELITLLHRLISEHQLEKLEKILREEKKKALDNNSSPSCGGGGGDAADVVSTTPTPTANGKIENQSPPSEHSRTDSTTSTNSANSANQASTGSGSELTSNGLMLSSTNVEPKKKQEVSSNCFEKFDIDGNFISEQTGRTLLMTAVAHENIKIIRLLHKEFDANLEFRDKRGRTAVFYACNVSPHKTAMILQYLVGEGANVNLKDNEDNSPFYLCMESQNFQAATVLYADGKADVNTQVGPAKNTAAHIAIKKDLITSVHFLVKRCMCDLTIPNARGETPIFLALQHPAILNQILMDLTDKKVNTEVLDVNAYKLKAIEIEDENKNNCLHICAEFGYIDSIGEILSVLPEEIARRLSSSQNKDGNTPLHVAVSHNHPELTFVLLFVNPDCAFYQNSDWDTPLHVSLKQGNFKSAIILYPLSKYLDLENAEGQSIQYLVQLFGQELKQQEDTLKKLTEGEFYKPGSYYFESLLQDFSFISRMKDYLTASNQQDTITFFETVMEYQLVPTTSQRYEMAERIVQQYLSDNSKVKFLKPKKEEFLAKWKEYSKIFCPAYLFESCLDLALDEMRQNLFPKFVSSKVFKKWVENKAKSDPTFYLRFIKRETIPQEQQEKIDTTPLNLFEETLQVLEEQENELQNRKTCSKCGDVLLDMNDYLFVNGDFDKAIEQSMDFIGWTQLESDQTLGKAYTSPKGAHIHLDTKKKHSAVKFTGHLEHSNHAVFNMWIDPEYLYMRDPSILTSKQIDTASSRHFTSIIYHDIYSMAWPNSNREFLTSMCCTYRANTNTYICLQKSVTHPKCAEGSKQVRAKIKSLFIVERINDTRSKYTYQVVSDFGGFLGSDFYANMIKDRGNFFHLLLSRTVKARELSGKGKPSNSGGGLVESLDYAIAHSNN